MKSLLKKSLYAGLGLLGTGADTVERLGRDLAKKADISEQEGEKIARKLRSKSQKALMSIRKTLDAEVTKVADVLHAATAKDVASLHKKKAGAAGAKKKKVHRKAKSKDSQAGVTAAKS